MAASKNRPFPENAARSEIVMERRAVASRMAERYAAKSTEPNGDEARLADEGFPASFTKGLPHDAHGVLENSDDYIAFVKEINQQDATSFDSLPRGIGANGSGAPRVPRTVRADGTDIGWRGWESPRTGHYFDLQGPDADAVGMPPAPELGSEELSAEMAEVYALALLRDVSFDAIADGSGHDAQSGIGAGEVLDALSGLSWFGETTPDADQLLSLQERRRRAARRVDHGKDFPIDAPPDAVPFGRAAAFRGSGPAVKAGPYLSQFMLLGNSRTPGDGSDADIVDSAIAYGAQLIDQKIQPFPSHRDFMVHWNAYVDVQNGANFGDASTRVTTRRFIATPRDLAAYVRFDALYQAYLNACLYMLGEDGRFPAQQPVAHPHTGVAGPGFPDRGSSASRQAFASFGAPHVLSLVTEVATRCLKAVRRQKFNYHRRARPERIGALLTLHGTQGAPGEGDVSGRLGSRTRAALGIMSSADVLGPMLALVARHNAARKAAGSADAHLDFADTPDVPWLTNEKNYLLPMAFAEGSPMHPSYGAGHATVAGGCVTMLKAFFHTVDTSGERAEAVAWPTALPVVRARPDGSALERLPHDPRMSVAGELNKLAANISIGRDMAGVHFYTDYYESLRMGERVATGILVEQMQQYNEPVEMDFESFDGDHVHIVKTDHDYGDPRVFVHDAQGEEVAFDDWWVRHLAAAAPAEAPPVAPVPAVNLASGTGRKVSRRPAATA